MNGTNNDAAIQANEQRIDEIFDSLKKLVLAQGNYVKEQMRTMTLEQQQQMIAFFAAFMEMFNELLDSVMRLFRMSLDDIKQETKINRKKLRAIFDEMFIEIDQILWY